MTRRTRWLAVAAGAVVVAATTGVVGATQAGAAAPGQVPPEGTVCTSQIRADAGATLTGSSSVNNGSGPLWSMRVASAPAGAESEVLRTPARTLPATSVVPPAPGTWFFRGCVRNTGPLPTTIRIQLNPI
jgi:hypothetical protein